MVPGSPLATLFLDPLSYHLAEDRLFDAANVPKSGERILAPYVLLRQRLAERQVATHTGDMIGRVPTGSISLYATMGIQRRWPRLARREDFILSAFLVNECPVAEPRVFSELDRASAAFRRLYSFAGDAAMAEFTRNRHTYRPYRYPYPFDEVEGEAWARGGRSFLTMINGNKVPRIETRELYSERMRAIEYFEARGEIDLFGVGWNGPPYRIGQTSVPRPVRKLAYEFERGWDRLRPEQNALLAAARRAWRGAVLSKADTLSRYTYAICFENMVLEGWVTEKVFDCLRAGTIPVYLGAPDVDRWLDPASYIDMRKFGGFDELRSYLLSLGPSEITAFREAGREYFHSDRFRPFTKSTFASLVEDFVLEDLGVTR